MVLASRIKGFRHVETWVNKFNYLKIVSNGTRLLSCKSVYVNISCLAFRFQSLNTSCVSDLLKRRGDNIWTFSSRKLHNDNFNINSKINIGPEEKHFRQALMSLPAYQNLFLSLESQDNVSIDTVTQQLEDISDEGTLDELQSMKMFCQICCIPVKDFRLLLSKNKKLNAFLMNLTRHKHKTGISVEEFLEVTKRLRNSIETQEQVNNKLLMTYFKILDNLLQGNSLTLELSTMLKIFDTVLHFSLYSSQGNFANLLKYKEEITVMLQNKILNVMRSAQVDANEFVFFMLLMSHSRREAKEFQFYLINFMSKVKGLENLSLAECAIICLGFFKNDLGVLELPFLEMTLIKLEEEAATANEFIITSIFKSVSRTFHYVKILSTQSPNSYDTLKRLINNQSFVDNLGRMPSNFALLRCMSVCFVCQISSDRLESTLKNRLEGDSLDTCNDKDLGLLAFIVGNMMYGDCSDILANISNQFLQYTKDLSAIQEPITIFRLMTGSCRSGFYPNRIVDYCLSPEMQRKAANSSFKKDYRRDMFEIDQSVRLEKPEYKGSLLTEYFLSEVAPMKRRTHKLTERDLFARNVTDCIRRVYGNINYIEGYILPHFEVTDIRLCFQNGQLYEVPFWSQQFYVEVLGFDQYEKLRIPVNDPTYQWVVLCLNTKTSYLTVQCDDGSEYFRLMGYHHSRQRQIAKRGYTVIPVSEYDFEAAENKDKFISDLIQPHLKMEKEVTVREKNEKSLKRQKKIKKKFQTQTD